MKDHLEHLEMTVLEIERHAARMTDLARQLREFGGMDDSPVKIKPMPAAENPRSADGLAKEFPAYRIKVETRKAKPVRKKVAVAATGQEESDRKRTSLSPGTLEKGLKIVEPINTFKVRAALDCNKKTASNTITRWLSKGYLKRTGFAEYVRTRKYPSAFAPVANRNATAPAEVPAGRIHIERLDGKPKPGTKAEVEAALDQALKDRDKANAAGQETLARIYQDKVDKLQAQLEALEG